MRILITELNWPRGISLLQAAGDVTYDKTIFKDRPRLLAALAGVDALIVRNQTRSTRISWPPRQTSRSLDGLGWGWTISICPPCARAM